MNRSCFYNNENYLERFELATERIKAFKDEELTTSEFKDYFDSLSIFVAKLSHISSIVLSGELYSLDFQALKTLNNELYIDVLGDNYNTSYCNPDYACLKLSNKYGKLLSSLYFQAYGMIYEAFAGNISKLTVLFELIIEIYGILSKDNEYDAHNIAEAIYYYHHDYCYDFTALRQRRVRTPEANDILPIIKECALEDNKYLFYYGAYISENELKIHEYLNKLDDEVIEKIAFTFVDGYVRGFAANGIDFSERKNVEIRYPIGYERIIKRIVEKFEAMGKGIIMYMDDSRRIGVSGTLANRQMHYDHRNDFVLFMNAKYTETAKKALRAAYKAISEVVSVCAGPACLETFGEEEWTPVAKDTVFKPSDKENELSTKFKRDQALILREFLNMEKVSFTIMALPLPSIGENFSEIFDAVIKVNTLDNDEYKRIQQAIIDVLDTGKYVRIKGAGENKTDLKVVLHTLNDPEKETNFENCTADVNIPVGEVFTSPVLTGTEGVLNVKHAFLEGYEYKDLTITFKDGMTDTYSCTNFESEEENKKHIEENILFRHKSLPIGEFAIGTNTTAYKMAGDFNIWPVLPILIAEKTGPHFAVGDTCYSDMEDVMTYNPDGKAIIARDNEVSILRKEDRAKAYFNCHTDITIPYDELDYIRVFDSDDNYKSIIENGRFVVSGTEELNKVF